MWKSFNFWFGVAIATAVVVKAGDVSTNTLVLWCFLSLVNFIFALEQTLANKNN